MPSGDLRLLGAGLDVQGQRRAPAAFPEPIRHRSNEDEDHLRQQDGDQRRQVDVGDRRHDAPDQAEGKTCVIWLIGRPMGEYGLTRRARLARSEADQQIDAGAQERAQATEQNQANGRSGPAAARRRRRGR